MTPPRLLRAALAASLCLARAGLAEPTYHLSKAPAFRPGDTAAVSLTEQTVLSVTDAEGKLLRHEKDATSQQLLDEVLTVDEAGRVTSFRQKIVLAEHRSWAGADREQPDATTRLADVFAVARRAEAIFRPDTRTIASPAVEALTAPQLWLLKQVFRQSISFHAHPEVNVLLLPAEPVPVGHRWKPSADVLERWVRATPAGRQTQAKATGAEFRLASVTDGVATVIGTVRLQLPLGKAVLTPTAELTCRIDAATGLWKSTTRSMAVRHEEGGATFVYQLSGSGAAAVARGSGEPTPTPGPAHPLGWAPPEDDANRYRNVPAGVSLDVPPDCVPRKLAPDDQNLAQFDSPDGISIALSVADYPQLYDLADRVPLIVAGLKKLLPGFEVQRQEELYLPGQVPAVLVAGKGTGGASLLAVIALDGKRLAFVRAGVPAAKASAAAQVEKALRTLRVFDPNPAAGE